MSKPKYKISSIYDALITSDVITSAPVIINSIVTKYFVTTDGKVFTVKNGRIKVRIPKIDKSGYAIVEMRVDDRRVNISVHRLVASAFIPNPEDKPEVNHIDGNKLNNDKSNLEWSTRSENMIHSYDTGLHRRGSDKTNSRYNNEQINTVCKLLEENKATLHQISSITSVSIDMISSIRKKKKWRHISEKYNIDGYNAASPNRGSVKKYTDEQIRRVCELLEKHVNSTDISLTTGVSTYVIHDVKRGRSRKDISKDFNF